jgi:AraC-like DNA-binding protein/ligand-binding sensor protein
MLIFKNLKLIVSESFFIFSTSFRNYWTFFRFLILFAQPAGICYVLDMENADIIKFDDLAESREFRQFFEIVRELTGIQVVLVDPADSRRKVLYQQETETPLCRLIHVQPDGLRACYAEDHRHLQQAVAERKGIYYLCHAGLIDIVVPIYVRGAHVANMICGQVLPEPPSHERFQQLRRKLQHLQIPEKALWEAYFKSPSCPVGRIKTIIKLFSFFTEYFSEVGWRLKQINQKEFLPVQCARQYIHDNFRKPLKLMEMAKAVFLSPGYLSSLFHHYTGLTITGYIQLTRVNAAKDLLVKTAERITDIAFDTGFNNLTHFNRTFRKITGYSPREYRQKNKPAAHL